MSKHEHSIWRIYGFALSSSLVITLLVGWRLGLSSLLTVLVLAGIEISFSFDNAIINAKILQRMSKLWQQLFMTVGIIIAVFVVRMLVPLLIVSVTAHLSLGKVTNLVLHHPAEYSDYLKGSHSVIAAFGGMFLLMIFLDFIFEARQVMWLEPLEKRLAKVGKLETLSIFIAFTVMLVATLTSGINSHSVFWAGSFGIFLYLAVNTLEGGEQLEISSAKNQSKSLIKAGLIGFLYLEMIDASFSLDSVIGAFAITTNILLITAGLAIGALFVRAMTIHLLRRGTLAKYIYLEHGAHYAIGLLALLLLTSIRFEMPEWLTGLSGITIIGLALLDSYFEAKREKSSS